VDATPLPAQFVALELPSDFIGSERGQGIEQSQWHPTGGKGLTQNATI
jgi:hypothetical protein